MSPTRARGAAAIGRINASLMPLAKSDGSAVDDEVETALKDQIVPTTVAIRQMTASKRETAPAQTIQRVARVRGAAVDTSPGW